MKYLNETTSLSPLTKKVIPAKILTKDHKIYMEKYDENNKKYCSLIENDIELYNILTATKQIQPSKANVAHIHTTSKCNLNCLYCYAPKQFNNDDITEKDLIKILRPYKNHIFVFSGREPTCHPNLTQLIKLTAKNNLPVILTNGIKLTDLAYLKALKQAGLWRIVFSLNGFSDDVFKKTNGQALLKTKLKALDNIKKLNIHTEISVTVAKGVNEKELKPIFKYCIDNTSWIKILRIRTTAPIGKYASENTFLLSEMIDLFSKPLDIPYSQVINSSAFMQQLGNYFSAPHLKPRRCSVGFYMSQKNTSRPIAGNFNLQKFKKLPFPRLILTFLSIKNLGFIFTFCSGRFATKALMKLKIKSATKKNLLKIELRRWPNINDIDLEENNKCTSHCLYTNETSIPFCYNNIIGKNQFSV